MKFSERERSGREFPQIYHTAINQHVYPISYTVDLLSNVASGSSDVFPATDLDVLERALDGVSDMLDRVLAYVRSVLAGEVKGDAAVGRYLLDTFGASTEELEKGAFNASLQVRTNLRYSDTMILRLAISGHTHGFLPRKLGSLTSGSIFSSGFDSRIVGVQKLSVY